MIFNIENIEWAPPTPIPVRTQPYILFVSPILEIIIYNILRQTRRLWFS